MVEPSSFSSSKALISSLVSDVAVDLPEDLEHVGLARDARVRSDTSGVVVEVPDQVLESLVARRGRSRRRAS